MSFGGWLHGAGGGTPGYLQAACHRAVCDLLCTWCRTATQKVTEGRANRVIGRRGVTQSVSWWGGCAASTGSARTVGRVGPVSRAGFDRLSPNGEEGGAGVARWLRQAQPERLWWLSPSGWVLSPSGWGLRPNVRGLDLDGEVWDARWLRQAQPERWGGWGRCGALASTGSARTVRRVGPVRRAGFDRLSLNGCGA
jgi:hypothetical protein